MRRLLYLYGESFLLKTENYRMIASMSCGEVAVARAGLEDRTMLRELLKSIFAGYSELLKRSRSLVFHRC